MKSFVRISLILALSAALCAPCAALAESEMPIVTDVPITEEYIAQLEAEEAERLSKAQQLLIDLGYLSGAADGIYGPRTASALRSFQEANRLEATGELDEQTMQALEAMRETAQDVKSLQQRLIDLGYLSGAADGLFGKRSQAALELFQALNDLEVTGMADDDTRERLFADDVSALPARLSAGSKGERVTALQEKLIQFGFLAGRADGSYGKQTAAAVKRLQNHLISQGIGEALGITASGEATPATQALLYDPAWSSYLADISPDDTGDEVQRVERRLLALGYMDMQADDVFDDYAVRSAQAFQSEAGLADTAYDKAFFDALFSADAPQAGHYVLHDIAVGDGGRAVQEVEELLERYGFMIKHPNGSYDDATVAAIDELHAFMEAASCPDAGLYADSSALSAQAVEALPDDLDAFAVSLSAPESEMEVRRVQRRLHTLYYLSRANIDGVYGDGSREAMTQFQQTNGLTGSGEPDEASRRRLYSADAAHVQRPYLVEVDIDRQRVYVSELQEDGEYLLTHTFVCSTGVGNTTPRGIYLDGYPANYWHHFEKFNCWAKYSFEIEGDIMFHSVIFSKKDTKSLRKNSLYALGQKASHGCVRLKVSDARWLFEHCKRGSLVIVIY